MKKAVLILTFLMLASNATADIESMISDQCGAEYAEVISLSNPAGTDSHPGPPSLYDQKLCVSGITEAQIADSCNRVTAFYLWSEDEQSHFSELDSYNKHVCTGRMSTNVRTNSCLSNETALFSVSDTENAHAASPSVFDNKVCGAYIQPQNITVKVKFNMSSSDQVYFDDEQVTGEQGFYPPAEFPYMVSQDSNTVSGLVPRDFQYAEREINGENVLSIRKESSSASYYFPFTEGDHDTIEQREDLVLDNQLLNQLKPSFGYFIPETPQIRVSLDPGVDIDSDLSIGAGTHEINIRKTGNNTVRIY